MIVIQKETPEQGSLLKNEKSQGKDKRTMVERLHRVLQLLKNLETKMRLDKNMSGVKEFVKSSKEYIANGAHFEGEFEIKERPGLWIFGLLDIDKNVQCRMILKIEKEGTEPQYIDLSGYYED